ALKFIENAVKRTPANTAKTQEVIKNIRSNYGDLFLVLNNYRTTGIVYIHTYYTDNGKVICPVLVGGEKIREWQPNLRTFLIEMKERTNAFSIDFIARKGWHKLYPECRNIGTIYRYTG